MPWGIEVLAGASPEEVFSSSGSTSKSRRSEIAGSLNSLCADVCRYPPPQKPGSSLASIPTFVVDSHPTYWGPALVGVGCG